MMQAKGEAPQGPRAVVPQRQVRAALDAGDLLLHYQPVVSLGAGRVVGAEALLRCRSLHGALLAPDDFLPAIAHTPVMHDITRWVVDRALAYAAEVAPLTVAINVAAVDVVRPSLVTAVRDGLRRHGVAPQQVTIELTEHAAVQGMDRAIAVLRQLRALGVELALDDFGTGYSSLLYLRDLPVTQVKIDRTFVSGIGGNEDDAAIVRSVVQLAHRVGLTVVAEGVETVDQLHFLRAAQCDFVQGHLVAMPSPELAIDIDRGLFAPVPRGVRGSRRLRPSLSATVRAQITELATQGASLHTIAAALNRDGVETTAGTRWTAASVARAMTGP